MTNYKYYRCLHCNGQLRTTVDNPDNHIRCVLCGHTEFAESTKEEFETDFVDTGDAPTWT